MFGIPSSSLDQDAEQNNEQDRSNDEESGTTPRFSHISSTGTGENSERRSNIRLAPITRFTQTTALNEIKPKKKIIIQSAASNEYYSLGGLTDDIVITNILTFLTARDLSLLSQCSRYFYRATSTKEIWTTLITRDFLANADESNSTLLTMLGSRDFREKKSSPLAKHQYLRRYADMTLRSASKRLYNQEFARRVESDEMTQTAETYLDLFLFRLLVPLPFLSIFLSLLLLALYFDGLSISVWWCAFPTLFFFVYSLLCLLVAYAIKSRRNIAGAAAVTAPMLWTNLTSPVKFMLPSSTRLQSRRRATAVVVTFCICLAQVILVTVKMSAVDQQSQSGSMLDEASLPWGVVFLPTWMLLILYCILPSTLGLVDDNELALFVLGVIVLWIPITIVLVCVTLKLTGEAVGNDTWAGLRLALIFIPFWVIEGAIMMGSLMLTITGFFQYRAGLRDHIYDYLGTLLFCWLITTPFVVFQALLCAYDDGYDISHALIVTPLLVVIGLSFLSAAVLASKYITRFEEMRTERVTRSAGVTDMYKV